MYLSKRSVSPVFVIVNIVSYRRNRPPPFDLADNGEVIVTLLPVNEKFPWVTPARFRPELVPEELMAPVLTVSGTELPYEQISDTNKTPNFAHLFRNEFSVDGGGVRANDGQADHRHEVHRVQHLLQEDPRHMDRHRIYYSSLSPLLRLSSKLGYFSQVVISTRTKRVFWLTHVEVCAKWFLVSSYLM